MCADGSAAPTALDALPRRTPHFAVAMPPAQAPFAQRPRPRLIDRLFRRRPVPLDISSEPETLDAVQRAPAVDAHTHRFWSSGVDSAQQRGGSRPGATGSRHRVAAMIAAHDAGVLPGEARRPRGNPAFSEALFVELMRAHQYRRAFEQLSADCQRSWGSADAFVAAQGASAMSRLRGVQVKSVRYLDEWTDPERGSTYQGVAELQVEYTIGDRDPARILPRVVHLVADSGRWRSLCYPAA
jgi:hypothetical protein